MDTIMITALSKKATCFAIPSEFHMVKLGCENCEYADLCGATITVLVAAIESKARADFKILVPKLPLYRSGLDYWDNWTKHAPVVLKEADLQFFLQRAVDSQEKKDLAERAKWILPDVVTNEGKDHDVSQTVATGFELQSASPSLCAVGAGSLGKPSTSPPPAIPINPSKPAGAAIARPPLYVFPMPTERHFESWSDKELSVKLVGLIREGISCSTATGYDSIRDTLCSAHIEMNLRQRQAPRFRPTHMLDYKSADPDVINASRDRQVIDIHWRAHSFEKPCTQPNNYPNIFSDDPFDLGAAERFSQEGWRMGAKVVHLYLDETMQWEHAILQSAPIRAKWKTIEFGDVKGLEIRQPGKPHITNRLHDAMTAAGKRQGIIHIPAMVVTWAARRIVGENIAAIVRMIALMTGEKQRDRSAVRRTVTSLDDHLGGIAGVSRKP